MDWHLLKKFKDDLFHLLICIVALCSLPVFAETAASTAAGKQDKVVTKDKRQNLSFEDELVEGQASKPELFYLFQKKNFNYKRLIKLRDNFNPELRKSVEDIQHIRRGSQ